MSGSPFHVELLLVVLLAAFVVRVIVCWFSPIMLMENAEPYHWHQIPVRITREATRMGVRLYLVPGVGREGMYAFATYVGLHRVVCVDSSFARFAQDRVVEFVLAHELGHHEYGHTWKRLWLKILGLRHREFMRGYFHQQEHEANKYAEALTGLPRSIVWGVTVRNPDDTVPGLYGSEPTAGGSSHSEEKKA